MSCGISAWWPNFTIVHATLDGPQRWGYVFDKLAAAAASRTRTRVFVSFGHTHVPWHSSGIAKCGRDLFKFKIEPGRKYLLNVGQRGPARDGNPKAAYAIYDMDEGFGRVAAGWITISKDAGKIREGRFA